MTLDKISTPTEAVPTSRKSTRETTKRRKVYERVRETEIPQALIEEFRKDDWELKLIRWSINGEEDYRNLAQRKQEGYEFVTADELPAWYKQSIRITDTSTAKGLITFGDLCLAKIDKDLRKSRSDHFQKVTDNEVSAVDIHVLEKKGFRNLGTRSRVMTREPGFAE